MKAIPSLSAIAVLLGTQWASAADMPVVSVADHVLNVQKNCVGQWFSDDCEQAIAISNSKMTYDYLTALFESTFDDAAVAATMDCSQNLDDWKTDVMTGTKTSPFPETCDAHIETWGPVTGIYPDDAQRHIMRFTNQLTDGEEETSTHSLMESLLDNYANRIMPAPYMAGP